MPYFPTRKRSLKCSNRGRSGRAYYHPRRLSAVPRMSLGMSKRALASRPELKYNDAQENAKDVVDTGTWILLNGIAQGTEAYQRVGRQILMKMVSLKLSFTQQNGAVNAQMLRWMLVYDRQPNGAVFTNTQLLDNSVALLSWTRKPTNPDNRDRFVILRDKTIQVNPNLLEYSVPIHDEVIPLNLFTQFNGSGGLISNITTGSLYLVFFDQAPLGLINLKTSFSVRVHYLDS